MRGKVVVAMDSLQICEKEEDICPPLNVVLLCGITDFWVP